MHFIEDEVLTIVDLSDRQLTWLKDIILPTVTSLSKTANKSHIQMLQVSFFFFICVLDNIYGYCCIIEWDVLCSG